MNSQTLIMGDFDLVPNDLAAEGNLHITVKPIDMVTYWRRCGAVSNFVGSFYNITSKNSDHENLISTIFNELIENAAKYSTKRDSDIIIDVQLYNTILKMQIENACNEKNKDSLTSILNKLISFDDINDLYYKEIEKKMTDKGSSAGIGLIMLKKDFNIKIGAKFLNVAENEFIVTMQIYYFMNGGNDL